MTIRPCGTDDERLALDIFIGLSRASSIIERRVHAPLREHGLTGIQFGVLDTVYCGGAMPISVVAEKNLCSQNSLCSVIDTMERNGHVRRTRSASDRRVVSIDLTPTGRELYEVLRSKHLSRIVDAMSHMRIEDLETLNRLLKEVSGSA